MKQIQGDLLKIGSGILVHQVNAFGVTGGLAGALHRKYPSAFDEYLATCYDESARVGDCIIGEVNDRLSICHLFGQFRPGPNTDLVAVDSALKKLAMLTRGHAIGSIFAPHLIGCGLGGGNWTDYLPILVKHIPDIVIIKKYD